jgi:hypothetical protein
LDTCRKCSKDLTTHKGQFGIEFHEPVSLGILTFVEGRAAASAAVGGALDIESAHDANVFMREERSTEEISPAVSSADDIKFDFDDSSTVEVATQGSDSDGGIGIDMGADMENIASDSGFSLNLGDDIEGGGDLNLSIGEDKSTGGAEVEDADGISLNLDALGDEGGQIVMKDIDISLEEDSGGPIVIGGGSSKSRSMELDVEDIGGLEIDMDEFQPDNEPTAKISTKDAQKAAAKDEDDFADIELSLDDKDLFADNKDDKDGDIDLGDLDLKIGDDDFGLKL